MKNDLLQRLNAIVDETKKQNEKKGFQNLIVNLYNFGVYEGGQMCIGNLFKSSQEKPTKNGYYLVHDNFFKIDDSNAFRIVKYDNENGWGERLTESEYWIDIMAIINASINIKKTNNE